MILVDTSIWIDHFRRTNSALGSMLQVHGVLSHPMILGELACGNLRSRYETLDLLQRLPQIMIAEDREVLSLIEKNELMGLGVSWIDAHLLASVILDGSQLWTRDRILVRIAGEFGCLAQP